MGFLNFGSGMLRLHALKMD